MASSRGWGAAAAAVVFGALLGCGSDPAPSTAEPVRVGLLLSFSGYLAANSINSERAVLMAIDAANAAGGIEGRPLEVISKDTRSDVAKVSTPARQLLDAGAAVLIGPDTTDLVTQVRALLQSRTVLLPSFNTASDVEWKVASWFVMGAGISRVTCEIVAQLRADGRQHPLVVANPTGFNSSLAWELGNGYGMPKVVLPTDRPSTRESVQPITGGSADSYVLAAFPASASSLMIALAATGALTDPGRWYLSPTLHTPAFLESIARESVAGAHGVAPGTVAGAYDFGQLFAARWQDEPLDDAYPFYDAAMIAALALERAMLREQKIPEGTGLAAHVVAVTHAGGTPVQWNEVDKGFQILRDGGEIEYVGLSGRIEFDASGQAASASPKWFTIDERGFEDVGRQSDCQ